MGNSKTCQHVDHVDKKILFRCLRIGMFPTNCHQTKSRSLMSKTSAFSLARDSVAAEGTTTEPSSSALLHTSASFGSQQVLDRPGHSFWERSGALEEPCCKQPFDQLRQFVADPSSSSVLLHPQAQATTAHLLKRHHHHIDVWFIGWVSGQGCQPNCLQSSL